jgi:hypothetical protein
MQKGLKMTNVQQQDARLIAMDAATVAAIRLHAPEFEAAYLDDNLPRWFQRLLDNCTTIAEHVADRTDAALIETLPALLGHALGRSQEMADHDAPGIVPEARCRDELLHIPDVPGGGLEWMRRRSRPTEPIGSSRRSKVGKDGGIVEG